MIHCITRLRFYLKDEALADDSAVIDIDEVIDVARSARTVPGGHRPEGRPGL